MKQLLQRIKKIKNQIKDWPIFDRRMRGAGVFVVFALIVFIIDQSLYGLLFLFGSFFYAFIDYREKIFYESRNLKGIARNQDKTLNRQGCIQKLEDLGIKNNATNFIKSAGDSGLVEIFLTIGVADINYALKKNYEWELEDRYTALQYACDSQNMRSVKLLLDAGADPNIIADGKHCLFYATKHENRKMIQLLIQHGADADSYFSGDHLRHLASNCQPEMVMLMVEDYKVSVNDRDAKGNTPLIAAAMEFTPSCNDLKKKTEIIEFLLKNGADVNKANNKGETPLLVMAKTKNSYSALKLLLLAGADPNVQDLEGKTALTIIKKVMRDERNLQVKRYGVQEASISTLEINLIKDALNGNLNK